MVCESRDGDWQIVVEMAGGGVRVGDMVVLWEVYWVPSSRMAGNLYNPGSVVEGADRHSRHSIA